MVSAAAASTDSCRSSTLASSATDLMSQRAQRVSAAVTQATPFSSSAGRSRPAAGAQKANTVRGMSGSGAWLRPNCGAARHLPVDVPVAAAVALDERGEDRAPLLARVRILHADAGKAARQPLAVGGEAERPAGVHRHELVDAVGVQKAAVERRDARLGERQVAAVQIAERQRLGHAASLQWNHKRDAVDGARPQPALRHGGERHERRARDHVPLHRSR